MDAGPPPPPPPPFLRAFLAHDFARRCRPEYYCFACPRPICAHCCPDHRERHHPPAARIAIPRVRLLQPDYPAVSHDDAKGCGYSLKGIQHLKYGQEKYVPIRRRPVQLYRGNETYCKRVGCGRRTQRSCMNCSIECRLLHPECQGGTPRGRANAAALMAANDRFLQEVDPDRFCTHCRRLFHSALCDHHIANHHPGLGELIEIVRHDGRVLTHVAAGALPAHVLADVQVIAVGGELTVQVIPCDQPLEDVDGFGICLGDACHSVIGEAFSFCSLRCRARRG